MDLSPLSGTTYHDGRIPDGHTVKAPTRTPAPTSPPVTRRQLLAGATCFAILAAGPIIAVTRALWP